MINQQWMQSDDIVYLTALVEAKLTTCKPNTAEWVNAFEAHQKLKTLLGHGSVLCVFDAMSAQPPTTPSNTVAMLKTAKGLQ